MIALDPGNVQSAVVRWDGRQLRNFMKAGNTEIMAFLLEYRSFNEQLVIERVACYGMAVGESVFETVYWSGRFAQAYGVEYVQRMTRMEVKMHLCHSSRAKDTNVRQALIDRFGPVGKKKTPGPLYGVKADVWAALALAVTAWDLKSGGQ